MNVHYTSRQASLTPEVKDYCDRRLVALKRLLGFVTEVDVILSHEKNRYKAEVHIQAKGAGLVVVEERPDILSSLNLAFNSLEKKIKKEREKFREKKRRGGRERKSLALPEAAEPGEVRKKIIRVDHFSAKPMTVEEAVLELELKKREAFVFRLAGPETWATIYRRKDGHVGLIQPE
jgi:putative sigma-54 modulation protein